MGDLNQSLEEAVNIDDEVFFGPVTERERKIREQLEIFISNKKTNMETSDIAENETSINDSLYKSFPAEDSKYDSYEDSLNENVEENVQATTHVTLRRSYDKFKAKRHAFYDSLEDVCSIVSNIDKCSISCDIENESNVVDKHVEDSLIISAPVVINKAHVVNEQTHFDEDSLAVVECENIFDDSLEEINMISSIESIEIEEINDLDNIESENVVSSNEYQKPTLISRNLFDTVDIIFEKKNFLKANPDESLECKTKLFDSLSNSECKDAFKDSLEESENGIDKLNSLKSETNLPVTILKSSEKIDLDKSVQSVNENIKNFCIENNQDPDCDYVCKNLLENSGNINFHVLEQPITKSADAFNPNINESAILEQEIMNADNNMLDASIQILYEKNKNSLITETISKQNDIAKDNIESFKNACNYSVQSVSNISQTLNKAKYCSLSNDIELPKQNVKKINIVDNSGDSSKNSINCNYKIDKECGFLKDNLVSIDDSSKFIRDNSNSKEEAITIDTCQLKLLNDNLSLNKDLKLQFQIEVTVGGKKCKIESENIKIMPVVSSNECENIPSLSYSAKSYCRNNENKVPSVFNAVDKANCNEKEEKKEEGIPVYDVTLNENNTHEAFVLLKPKESESTISKDFEVKKNKSEGSLLQALDLHDVSLFLNESVIQSNDSLMCLNLCSEGQTYHKFPLAVLRDESKENFPELCSLSDDILKNDLCQSYGNISYKKNEYKTPITLKSCTNSRENSAKRTGGTRIPVRNVAKFAASESSTHKIKQTPVSSAMEKNIVHSPHSPDLRKKTPSTAHKTHHFCNVRNTIFSKVPQIMPSKKYMNVESPVAKYIRNAQRCTSVKTPVLDPVLRDCMNDIRFLQKLKSPYPSALPKGVSSSLTNKKV